MWHFEFDVTQKRNFNSQHKIQFSIECEYKINAISPKILNDNDMLFRDKILFSQDEIL